MQAHHIPSCHPHHPLHRSQSQLRHISSCHPHYQQRHSQPLRHLALLRFCSILFHNAPRSIVRPRVASCSQIFGSIGSISLSTVRKRWRSSSRPARWPEKSSIEPCARWSVRNIFNCASETGGRWRVSDCCSCSNSYKNSALKIKHDALFEF